MKIISGKRSHSRGRAEGAGGSRDDGRSFRWRANFMLALVVCAALGLVWRAVELQLKDHKFLAAVLPVHATRI